MVCGRVHALEEVTKGWGGDNYCIECTSISHSLLTYLLTHNLRSTIRDPRCENRDKGGSKIHRC